MTEVDEKVERVAQFAREQDLAGVLLTRQPHFAWITGGQSNRIDGSTDIGAGSLFVSAQGARLVVANAIEMPRLREEALADLGFEPLEYAWSADHTDAVAAATALRMHLQLSRDIGSDVGARGITDVSRDITRLQTPLTDAELDRYRVLGQDVARAVERLCRALEPGDAEDAVAARVNDVVARLGGRAIVTLVGGDDRIARFRHPVPTSRVWTHTLLVGLCAERDGLVVALSRMISARPVSGELRERTVAAASVFGHLLAETRPGVTGGQLFVAAVDAYRRAGHAGQEALHHQGGAIGYRSRDWIAHRQSEEIVKDRQAFAWNPSITGTKIEETALTVNGRIELITSTGQWPSITVDAGATRLQAPDILELR